MAKIQIKSKEVEIIKYTKKAYFCDLWILNLHL